MLLTVKEAIKELRIGKTTFYDLVKMNRIRHLKFPGGAIRIPADAVQEFVERCTVQITVETKPVAVPACLPMPKPVKPSGSKVVLPFPDQTRP